MRASALLLALSAIALPVYASRPVTVEQLEKLLAHEQGKSDADVSRAISELELTERLSTNRLTQLKTELPGEKSRQALVVLADTSVLLNPPASEIPATATPTPETQRRMMARTVEYIGKSLPLLPNLFATKETVRFENKPAPAGEGGPLHQVAHSAVTVLYRDNREFIDAGPSKDGQPQPPDRGLTTWGVFGPILGTVVIDAARSQLSWSHWELSPSGPEAVFSYAVPQAKSHYDVRYCCVSEAYGMKSSDVRERAGYHGQITVDPSTGAILRLTLDAELDAASPISRASMAVEYDVVEIGGKPYICPKRSVALASLPDMKAAHLDGNPGTDSAARMKMASALSSGPRQTLLNDISFGAYHLFSSEARVVPEKEKGGAAAARTEAATTAPTAPAADTARPAEFSNTTTAPADTVASVEEPAASPQPTAALVAPQQQVIPEISVSEATGLPKQSAMQRAAGSDNGFTLRISSHLVDVGVVALDKKGRPVTNLKPEDFEIYDNGVKQEVRSFGQTGSLTTTQASAPTPDQPELSNRRVAESKAGNEENTVVLLLDGSNLAFNDLVDARQQMVRFLQSLPGNDRVELMSMKGHGYEVLEQPSRDHAALATRLSKWIPTAQDLANAQESEDRNRQNMEYVHSPEDLLSVNGNFTADTDTQSEALDPKLRAFGKNSPRDAMSILVDVARHLAAVDGHKSLIWVTSDNALADWDQSSFSVEKTSKFIEPAALRVQEAMNNAHVSVYPLDASRLEGGAIEAGIYNRNVELTPTYQRPPQQEHEIEGPEAGAGTGDLTPAVIADRGQSNLGSTRLSARMQQDMRPIQGVFREIAAATGGQAFRRSNNLIGELGSVVADGRATYLLAFSPSEQADGKYHTLTVKLVNRRDAALRYRAGFQYEQEPTSIKDRFMRAVWQPIDLADVALTASPAPSASTIKLSIAAADLAIAQEGDFWTDRIDVFLVRRDDSGLHAKITGQTMSLRLKPESYQKFLKDGIPYEEIVEGGQSANPSRIIVVDENSGRMGSITLPSNALYAKK